MSGLMRWLGDGWLVGELASLFFSLFSRLPPLSLPHSLLSLYKKSKSTTVQIRGRAHEGRFQRKGRRTGLQGGVRRGSYGASQPLHRGGRGRVRGVVWQRAGLRMTVVEVRDP